jgi:hypothetical protein
MVIISSVVVAGQCRQILDKGNEIALIPQELPTRLNGDSPKALFTAHLEDFLELHIHPTALVIGLRRPGVERLIRFALFHWLRPNQFIKFFSS